MGKNAPDVFLYDNWRDWDDKDCVPQPMTTTQSKYDSALNILREILPLYVLVVTLSLDESTAQGVIETYTVALQAGNAQGATRLQTSIKRATTQRAEIDADLKVTQAEMKAGLQATYDAMMNAQFAGDQKAYNAAAAKYKADFEIVRAKNEAAKLRAENKANTVNDTAIEMAMSLQEKVNSTILQAKKEFEGAGEKPKAGGPDGLEIANNVLWNEDGATGELVTAGAGDIHKIAESDNNTKFAYNNNPMDNPKAAKDIVENPNAVYGYSPNPKSDRIGKYSDYDWTDPKQVELIKARREVYHIKMLILRA